MWGIDHKLAIRLIFPARKRWLRIVVNRVVRSVTRLMLKIPITRLRILIEIRIQVLKVKGNRRMV